VSQGYNNYGSGFGVVAEPYTVDMELTGGGGLPGEGGGRGGAAFAHWHAGLGGGPLNGSGGPVAPLGQSS
jgi:hypothetical protein